MPANSLRFSICLLLAITATANAEFTAITSWEQQIFPSYVIASAALRTEKIETPREVLGDPRGLLGVLLKSPGKNTPVKVTIECPEFLEASTFSGSLAEKGTTYRVLPKIKYNYTRLTACNQAATTNVTYRVQIGNEPVEEQTVTFTIRSINDCPIVMQEGKDLIDISFTFAAYANEQHPFVDKLLREAMDNEIVDKFTGYQGNDEKQVILQAYAIWDLFVARDMRYCDIRTTAADSNSVASQHVRLIEDTVNNSQANCVDGSVLWVSMMRKIGINAFLIFEPGHCYAGFYSDREQKHLHALETVLIGEEIDASELKLPKFLREAIPEDYRDDRSFGSFAAALMTGTAKFKKNESHYADGETDRRYRLINIASARNAGVLPIPFQNNAEFEWLEDSEEAE
jgi:hypothetical protein